MKNFKNRTGMNGTARDKERDAVSQIEYRYKYNNNNNIQQLTYLLTYLPSHCPTVPLGYIRMEPSKILFSVLVFGFFGFWFSLVD